MSKRFLIVDNKRAAQVTGLGPENFNLDPGWSLVEDLGDGSYRLVGSDGGEPEDQLLVRDWKWVVQELNKLADEVAYQRDLRVEAIEAEGARILELRDRDEQLAAERELHRSTLNRLAEVVKTSLSQKELQLLQGLVKDGWEYLDLDEDEEALGKKLGLR